jgi:hypothetical protein
MVVAHVKWTLVYEHGLGVPPRPPCETYPLLHHGDP